MAHIVAGHVDNDLDGAGVCGRCRVMVVKVTDARGRFRSDALAAAIRGAVEQGARVINLSLGPDPGAPPALSFGPPVTVGGPQHRRPLGGAAGLHDPRQRRPARRA